MGSPYAGADVFATDAVFPDDTDPPTASAFDVPLQTAFDRTIWLKNRIDALVPLDNLAALAAITTPTDKMVRLVQKFGWYVFRGTGSSPFTAPTALTPYAITPTDATPGRWVRAGYHRRFRQRAVTLSNCLLGTQFFTVDGGVARAKNVSFQSGNKTYVWSSGALQTFNWWEMINGTIRLVQAPPGATALTYGLQWCLDEVLSTPQIVGADLGTILGVQFGFAPATGRGALPTVGQAAIGVFRTPRDPGSTSWGTLTSLSAAGDFTEVGAASVADYELVQQVPIVCNQNNVVDLAAYTYYAQVWNEAGTNSLANNGILNVTVAMDDFTDAGIG